MASWAAAAAAWTFFIVSQLLDDDRLGVLIVIVFVFFAASLVPFLRDAWLGGRLSVPIAAVWTAGFVYLAPVVQTAYWFVHVRGRPTERE